MKTTIPLQTELITFDPESLATVRRGAMAKLCASLTPEDWMALESLGPRLRNEFLKLALRELLKRRSRR